MPSAVPLWGIALSYFESRRRLHVCQHRACKFLSKRAYVVCPSLGKIPLPQVLITATMERMTWRSSMQSERIVVLRRALSQKTGMFLRVPPSGDAGTCCLGRCEKRPCDGQSPSSVYQSYPGSLTSTTLCGGESPIVCGGYGIVSPWSRLRAAERKPGDHVGREGTCAQAQGDSLWLR